MGKLVRNIKILTSLVFPLHPSYTQFKVGGHVSLVAKISLHTVTPLSVGVVGNVHSKKKFEKRWILERFGVYFNIILP